MLLWRLSDRLFAATFVGGYGLHYDGRWNTVGHAVTYCSTSPSLCVVEKLVHIEDPALLPALVMVSYAIPDSLSIVDVALEDLPVEWRRNEAWTQQRGDDWHAGRTTPILRVPSAIVSIAGSPDLNVVVNHRHPDAAAIRIVNQENFAVDTRLI